MSHTIPAIYENGYIRPLQEIDLKDGDEVSVIIPDSEISPTDARDILSRIAQLPLEGPGDEFPGRSHDSVLYPNGRG